jgi:mono/diheme cytochrome c family protein/rhodanese-related sulfurtransferase/catechol 2,3-dioxygenase-like lactoylglutathione lyase family enzyme
MSTRILLSLIAICLCIYACETNTTKQADKTVHATASDSLSLLGNGFGILSATMVVKNLDSTRDYFAKVLGFDLPPAKKASKVMFNGTRSLYLNLPDQSALELLTIDDTSKQSPPAFIKSSVAQSNGVRMFALSTSSADTTLRLVKAGGFKTDTIQYGRDNLSKPQGWAFDDGGPQWRGVTVNSDNPPTYLPNFVELVGYPFAELSDSWKPYVWRKYYGKQPNGVVGMSSLLVVVADLKKRISEFKKMGLKVLAENDSMARFKIAHGQELHLTSSKKPGDDIAKFLQEYGDGVYALRFMVEDFKTTQTYLKKNLPTGGLSEDSIAKHLTVPRAFAKGVQLEFQQETKEQADLAKIWSFKEGVKLDSASIKYASGMYLKYCALCHGKDREGYAADVAPSLRSHALMSTTQKPRSAYNYLHHTVSYGRAGTAMAPYAKNQGGPLDEDDIDLLLQWLYESSGVKKPIELSAKPVVGNITVGRSLYDVHCARCHGSKGEGGNGPAIANPMLLATASDAFLRYTIAEGRDGTPMPSFKDSLSSRDLDALTAFVRSRASGWNAPEAVTVKKPLPSEYVLHPRNKAPTFKLREGLYVSAEQLLKAIKDSARIIMMDARSEAAWHQTHIPGAISVPYYEEPDTFIKDIPNDDTWIVAYCACPHAASTKVVNTLKRFGYKHTAILDEGILVWAQRGYPVQFGEGVETKKPKEKKSGK